MEEVLPGSWDYTSSKTFFLVIALFLYAGTLGNDGGYTKTGYPLKNVKGA